LIGVKADWRRRCEAGGVPPERHVVMGKLVYRLFAGALILAGAALFAAMMQVSYGDTREWDMALIRLGMPLSFLLPMVGAAMMVLGGAMLSQSLAAGRPKTKRRPITPGRWRGAGGDPK
jgi:hypothetical protein